LACDLRCPYYETCAIYGLNVERVFQDGKNNHVKRDVIMFSRVISFQDSLIIYINNMLYNFSVSKNYTEYIDEKFSM